MLAVLRQRDVALVWLAGLVSLLGDSVLAVALPFAVYQRAGAPATGALVLVQTLPQVLLGSVLGVVVDRLDRRGAMVAADLARAALLFLLLLPVSAAADAWLWLAYPVTFAHITLTLVAGPARAALLAELVAEERLPAANALDAANVEAVRLVGPPLGGALFVAAGLAGVVVLDAATFVLSAVALTLVRAPASPARRPGAGQPTPTAGWWSLAHEWLAGLRYVRGDRTVAGLFVVNALVSIGTGLWSVAWVGWVAEVLGGGPPELGWLLAARGVGGLAGGALAGAAVSRLPANRLIAAGLGLSTSLLLVLLHVPALPLALAVQTLAGVPAVVWTVAHRTLLQRSVPDDYRGRVFGALGTQGALSVLAGAGAASAATQLVGVGVVLDAACDCSLAAGLVALLKLPAAPGRRPQVPRSPGGRA